MPVESDEFRRVLGHFATGVSVVTANRPEGPVGMTCNALTSVSLEPPLIAVCPAKRSETWPQIRAAGRFVVNLMNSDHQATVLAFARKDGDRFAGVAYEQREFGPALGDAVAWIECELEAEHDAGDHTIALARVEHLEGREDLEPLVFFRGRYGTFRPID
jgi:3-hydroxy-9,10-secoandrosta-1,3,5(10)-triene-9,17-dione monooxygenase reductase component